MEALGAMYLILSVGLLPNMHWILTITSFYHLSIIPICTAFTSKHYIPATKLSTRVSMGLKVWWSSTTGSPCNECQELVV